MGNATVENSVIDGYCSYFSGKGYMQSGDMCRANGNAVSISMKDGNVVNFRHNTVISEGQGAIMNTLGGPTAKLNIQNNAIIGKPFYLSPSVLSSGHIVVQQHGHGELLGQPVLERQERPVPVRQRLPGSEADQHQPGRVRRHAARRQPGDRQGCGPRRCGHRLRHWLRVRRVPRPISVPMRSRSMAPRSADDPDRPGSDLHPRRADAQPERLDRRSGRRQHRQLHRQCP